MSEVRNVGGDDWAGQMQRVRDPYARKVSLTEFLTARLDDDESTARAASAESDGEWWAYHLDETQLGGDGQKWIIDSAPRLVSYEVTSQEAARHIGAHHPDRVLAEVGAKRLMLSWLSGERIVWVSPYPLRLLALPYADHPDYREEWKL